MKIFQLNLIFSAFLTFFFSYICRIYSLLVIGVPEILITRFLQTLTFQTNQIFQNNSKDQTKLTSPNYSKDPSEICSKLESILTSYNQLNKTFGYHLICHVGLNMFQIIFGTYYLISLVSLGGFKIKTGPKECALFGVSLAIILSIIRLFHLTTYCQDFLDSISNVIDDLICLESEFSKHGSSDIQKVRLRLQNISGLSAEGFFKVDRSLITTIFGHLLTYVIIMIEFKLNDL